METIQHDAPRDYFDDAILHYSAKGAKGLEVSSFLMTLAAFQRGLEVVFHRSLLGKTPRFSAQASNGLAGSVFSVSDGKSTHYFNRTLGDKTSLEASRLSQHKQRTKMALARVGIRTPEGVAVKSGDVATATQFMAGSGTRRFVVKPLRGSLSVDAHIDLPAREITEIIARSRNMEWLVEEYISGQEFRAYVVAEKCVGVAMRIHPSVVGNGVDSIERLLITKNMQREANVLLGEYPFKFSHADLEYLQKMGLSPQDVIPKGKVVTLSTTKSILAGADTQNVSHAVNDSFRQVAVASCRALGLPNAGLDILISDNPKRPGAFVLEANQRALVGSHSFPSLGRGDGNSIAEAIMDLYFPDSVQNRRFPGASFDFSSVAQALKSCQISEVSLPVLKSDWHHCRLEFPDLTIRDAIAKILFDVGGYVRLMNLANGAYIGDVLLSPASQAALMPHATFVAGLSFEIASLLGLASHS